MRGASSFFTEEKTLPGDVDDTLFNDDNILDSDGEASETNTTPSENDEIRLPLPEIKTSRSSTPVMANDTAFEETRKNLIKLMPQNAIQHPVIQRLAAEIYRHAEENSLRQFLESEKNRYPAIPGRKSAYVVLLDQCLEDLNKAPSSPSVSMR